MDYLNNTINTLPRERGQHLRFEDRCEIKALHKQGYSYRQIAKALNCSPSTVGYESEEELVSAKTLYNALNQSRLPLSL
ncbi:MAG: helix-turn-helix domain-containing protein [Veillonella sp.]|nr:helix-turn-helix domain-containing protein [Veillonella sp.]